MTKSYQHEKHFSIAEALQTLYKYHPLLEKMQDLAHKLIKDGIDLQAAGFPENPENLKLSQLVVKDYQQLLEVIEALTREGILVKGVEEGLIDFPHIRKSGEEVYLCYKLGEQTIQFWHGLQDGFSGRQPLENLES